MMAMRLPTFFLIGASKSGTTALHGALKQHPEIFMSPVKEPGYFEFEGHPRVYPEPVATILRRRTPGSAREYAMLFSGVANQRAIGEATVGYLQSPLAATRIRKNLPKSRLVVILRQPADRSHSLFTFLRQHGVEPATSLAEALRQEASRQEKGWYPGCLYQHVGCYHAHLSVYFQLFPREQIKVYLYEDWKDSPQATLRDLFGFLGVDPGFRPTLAQHNVTLWPRSERLHGWTRQLQRLEQQMPSLPASLLGSLASAMGRFNLAPPPPLDPELRARLTAGFREDILRLQDLIDRDLTHWLE